MKTICQRCSGWVSVLDRSLHRQTAVNVRFTDGKLKPLSSSEPSSNPPDYFNKNPHFTLKNMGAALFVCLWLWCFNVLIYYAPSVWKALQAITWKMESNSNRYFLFYFFFHGDVHNHLRPPLCPVASDGAFSCESHFIFQPDKSLSTDWQALWEDGWACRDLLKAGGTSPRSSGREQEAEEGDGGVALEVIVPHISGLYIVPPVAERNVAFIQFVSLGKPELILMCVHVCVHDWIERGFSPVWDVSTSLRFFFFSRRG